MLSANFFLLAAVLPTCLLWQAAGLGDALLAFLIAAGAALLFTLPARTGLLYRFAAALATPLWLFAFVTECVSFYAFADGGRFFPDYPIAILIVFALCALLIGIRGRAAWSGFRVLVGHHDAHFGARRRPRGRRAGRDAKSLILLAWPAVSTAACCTAGGQAEHGRRAGRGGDVVSAVSGALLRVRQRAADRAGRAYGRDFPRGGAGICGIKDCNTSPIGSLMSRSARWSAAVGVRLMTTSESPRNSSSSPAAG